jgi:hypothetical protein
MSRDDRECSSFIRADSFANHLRRGSIVHKADLTMALVQDAFKGTLHAGLGYLPVTHPEFSTVSSETY